MRKLATIRSIAQIKPHNNADALELAVVDGWQCVVKKGEFRPGDLVVYFEVDSVLPVRPEFEFLRKSSYVAKEWLPKGEGFRLKTIRLRGELSQGLVLKVTEVIPNYEFDNFRIGANVTNFLEIEKWDPPLPTCLQGEMKGVFPNFMPKTDQERAQNLVEQIQESFDNKDQYEVTIKLDGTSCTMYYNNGEMGVCSRNYELKVNEANAGNAYVRAFNVFEPALEKYGRNIAIQGELMGPGIQGNREKLPELAFFVFDVFDIDEQKFMSGAQKFAVIEVLGLNHVPIVDEMSFTELPTGDVTALLKLAEGPSINHPVREGLVWKRLDGKFSFKTIANNFLLEEK